MLKFWYLSLVLITMKLKKILKRVSSIKSYMFFFRMRINWNYQSNVQEAETLLLLLHNQNALLQRFFPRLLSDVVSFSFCRFSCHSLFYLTCQAFGILQSIMTEKWKRTQKSTLEMKCWRQQRHKCKNVILHV